MKFQIEQLALGFATSELAEKGMKILQALGLTEWSEDEVVSLGHVEKVSGLSSHPTVGNLRFNYQSTDSDTRRKPLELEVLNYETGPNWLAKYLNSLPLVSHIGMHCDQAELLEWKKIFSNLKVEIAQEVWTIGHTNKLIAGKRRYHYCIFNTRKHIGVDVKFIVRHDIEQESEQSQKPIGPANHSIRGDDSLSVSPAQPKHDIGGNN